MNLEQDYMEYVIEFSLALFAISAVYLIDLSNFMTLGFLVLIPLLFGYTAYISREEFKWSSMCGFISLIFSPLGSLFAAVAVVISVGNVLVSFFSGGRDFKDYYRSTMLPLLLTGLLLGGATYAATATQPGFGDDLRSSIAETIGNQTSDVLDETEIIEMQQKANRQMVKQVSTGTVAATQGYVLNETDFSQQQRYELVQAFDSAQQEVPERILNASSRQGQDQPKALAISERVSDSIENLLEGKNMLLLVPFVTLGMYGLQPVVGILTAIFAKLFQRMGRKKEQ